MLASVFILLGSKVKRGSGKLRVTCPLASRSHASRSDERPSMVVFPEGQRGDPICACSACHWKGAVVRLVDELADAGMDVSKAREMLTGEAAKKTDDQPQKNERREIISRVRALTHDGVSRARVQRAGAWFDPRAVDLGDNVPAMPDDAFSKYGRGVPRYALDRGLTLETCRAWGLGHDRRARRLMFALRDHRGRLVAMSGRLYACSVCGWSWPPREKQPRDCGCCGRRLPPKFLHSKGFKREFFLYGEVRKDIDRGDIIYVVEGNIDAPMLWQYGYRPVVATLGSNVSDVQVEKLVAWWNHILIVQDADDAGDSMVRLVKYKVAGRKKVSSVRPLDGMDPGSMSVDNAVELLGKPPFDPLT